MITEGPVRGHSSWNAKRAQAVPMYADATTLKQVKACAEQFEGGLKVKLNHGAGAEGIIGSLKGFSINGSKLTADLYLLSKAERRDYVLELAEKMPESCGLSIAFTGQDEPGEDKAFARCTEIYSCDLVDEPAANPDGLFSIHNLPGSPAQTDTNMDEKQFAAKIAELENKITALEAKIAALPVPVDASGKLTELSGKFDALKLDLEAKVTDRTMLAKEIAKQFSAVAGTAGRVAPAPTDGSGNKEPTKLEKFQASVVKHFAATKSKAKAIELAIKDEPEGFEASKGTEIKYS